MSNQLSICRKSAFRWNFFRKKKSNLKKYPLNLLKCTKCGLTQVSIDK